MISKKITLKKVDKSRFSKLVEYLLNPKENEERVGAVQVSHCESIEAKWAALEIELVQSLNTRAKSDKTYHLVVSFQAHEQPSPEVLKIIEQRFCDALGFNEHQRISVVHHDTNNLHIHLAINKIHPTSFTLVEPYRDFKIRDALCHHLEKEFHLGVDNHALTLSENDKSSPVTNRQGVESLKDFARRTVVEGLQAAGNWSEAHAVLAQNGLKFALKGRGLIIQAPDGTAIKASTLARAYSKTALEQKFGDFAPSKALINPKGYRLKPLLGAPSLYEQYQAQMKAQFHEHQQGLSHLSACSNARIRRLLAGNKDRHRFMSFLIQGSSPLAKRILHKSVHKNLQKKIERIQKEATNRRQRSTQKYKKSKLTYKSWLKTKALSGNLQALKALQATPILSKGNRITGEVVTSGLIPGVKVKSISDQGVVTYKVPGGQIKDDGTTLCLEGEINQKVCKALMLMARYRFNSTATLHGNPIFAKQMQQARLAHPGFTIHTRVTDERRAPSLSFRQFRERNHKYVFNRFKQRATQQSLNRFEFRGYGGSDEHIDERGRKRDSVRKLPKPCYRRAVRERAKGDPDSLQTLSQFPVVQRFRRTEQLLQAHAHADVQPRKAHPPKCMRRTGVILSSAERYIQERLEKRGRGMNIPTHKLCEPPFPTQPIFKGIRKVDGKPLVLMSEKASSEILVLPVNKDTEKQLKRLPRGNALKIENGKVALLRDKEQGNER